VTSKIENDIIDNHHTIITPGPSLRHPVHPNLVSTWVAFDLPSFRLFAIVTDVGQSADFTG
jgi:hypothetical protein